MQANTISLSNQNQLHIQRRISLFSVFLIFWSLKIRQISSSSSKSWFFMLLLLVLLCSRGLCVNDISLNCYQFLLQSDGVIRLSDFQVFIWSHLNSFVLKEKKKKILQFQLKLLFSDNLDEILKHFIVSIFRCLINGFFLQIRYICVYFGFTCMIFTKPQFPAAHSNWMHIYLYIQAP